MTSTSSPRRVPSPRTTATVAAGTCDSTGTFTLKLDRPVSCTPDERLTMELVYCRIPGNMSRNRRHREDLWFTWQLKTTSPGEGMDTVWEEKVELEGSDVESIAETLSKMCLNAYLGQYVSAVPVRGRGGTSYVWSVSITELAEDFLSRDQHPHSQLDLVLCPSEQLQLLLGWPSMILVADGGMLPPTNRHIDQRQSVNLMCEGVEGSRFQGTVKRPYVDSFRMLRRRSDDVFFREGGTIRQRAYRRPYAYVGPVSGELREVKMWVEDDYGCRHHFPTDLYMCASLMWKTTPREKREMTADPLEGTVVLTLDGDEGYWDMGGIVDWSGWSSVRGGGSSPPEYEVALLSISQSFGRALGSSVVAVGVTMPDFLADYHDVTGNLHVAPFALAPDGRKLWEEEDSLLEVAVPRYKRIVPAAVGQTRVSLAPIVSDPANFQQSDYVVRRATIVLHVRRINE